MTATGNKKVVILYNQVLEDAPKDEQDVLVQVEAVSRALAQLGYHPYELGFSLSINETIKTLKEINPVFVFNLTESVEGPGCSLYRVFHRGCVFNLQQIAYQKDVKFIRD